MRGIYYGVNGEQYVVQNTPDGGNAGRWPLGHVLDFGDGRQWCFGLNDATAEVAGDLYQSALPIANHGNRSAAVARTGALGHKAGGAEVISASVGATTAAQDLYMEGLAHINAGASAGLGFAYRIKRARAKGDAHAAFAGSDAIVVNLEDGESIQVSLVVTTSKVTYAHNRFRSVLIHDSPPTANLAGVAAFAAAASKWLWYQVEGYAPVLTQGTLIIGDLCVPSATVDGAVMPSAAIETDGPVVGRVATVNADGEISIIYLQLGTGC